MMWRVDSERVTAAEHLDVSQLDSDDLVAGFAKHLGLEVTHVSPDVVEGRWAPTPDLADDRGVLHRGAHSSVIETLASIAAAVWLGDRGKVVGVSNNADFFPGSADAKTFTSTATPLHRDDDQQLWQVSTVDGTGTLDRQGPSPTAEPPSLRLNARICHSDLSIRHTTVVYPRDGAAATRCCHIEEARMSDVLPSYLAGHWVTGSGDGTPVRDAVDGGVVTRVTSDGLDFAEAVAHARTAGAGALRELGFQGRAEVLKTVAAALSERKQELYDLSARAGSTRADAKVDVDGGFGTALVYASMGRKGLPAGNLIVEDDPIPLGREGTFVGQHVLSPRLGVAVQINAFNFPVWGMLEKLAPALLAGVPTIVKPASQTAYITEHAVRIMLEVGALPEGSLQLISGSVPGLLDLLDGQDLVGFTGSASTAARLRGHPAVTERSVRFNAEADSLNSSILGPDATLGTPEFDLYVDALVTEMTVKAGQKCTAIRRAFVPRSQVDVVAEAVVARLEKVVVGKPGEDGVTMGALVGHDQREDVRAQVAKLRSEAELVFGDPDRVSVVGADDQRGAFLSPLLLRATDTSQAPHEVEAFGPVSTLMPYDDTQHLVSQVARGRGSLAASVVSADPVFIKAAVIGIAAHHGRVLVLDRNDAAESTGHGTPMPQLIHGGPGRAGGGEEEGGLRAVHHHLQRTAIQGAPGLAEALAQ